MENTLAVPISGVYPIVPEVDYWQPQKEVTKTNKCEEELILMQTIKHFFA